jgi:catechol 2,3-dioxygenase-like lactoylglutathione lyase family enzyme
MDHVGLNVRDLDAMADWYVEAFGYRTQLKASLDELDLRIVMLVDDEGRRFELLARSAGAPGLRARTPVEAVATWGFGHVAFMVDDLAAAFRRLLALGASEVVHPQASPEDGLWFAFVHDPEGNLVELIGPAPE